MERKNGAVIRRFLGHERYSGQVAGQTIAHLHGAMRLYVNHFQPSFKLMEKTRNGSAVIKRYSPPATPCDRVIRHEAVSAGAKVKLTEHRATGERRRIHSRACGATFWSGCRKTTTPVRWRQAIQSAQFFHDIIQV